jgi:hypothetical protein
VGVMLDRADEVLTGEKHMAAWFAGTARE